MANSNASSGASELYFGSTAPTGLDYNDNDTFIVTSNGSETGTALEIWKFDVDTLTWILSPSGGVVCPAPMTRADLIALRNAGNLNKDCHYVITNPSADGNLDVQEIILHSVNSNTLGMGVSILTSHDTLAWEGIYDIDANNVIEVTDNLENKVISNASILTFPFGVSTVTDNIVDHSSLTYVSGTVNGNTILNRSNVTVNSSSFINNIVDTDATVVSEGNTQRNHFEANSNTTINSGDFLGNKVGNDSTIVSSSSLDVDGNTFGNNSNATISGASNIDNNVIDTDATITVSGGSLVQCKIGQLSGYIQSGGILRESTVGQDADVTIISGDNYENVFGNSTIYRQVGTGYIRYSTIEGTTTWTNGNTNVSNVKSYTSTINTTGSTGAISNSTLNRAYGVNLQDIPSLTITDSTISNYATIQTNGSARIYIYRSTVTDGARFLCGAGSRIYMNYTNINSFGYVQTTVSGSELYVNYSNIGGYSYVRNLTANSHRVERSRVQNSSNIRFEGTSSGCRAYYTTVDSGAALYFNGTSTNCYSYYNTLDSLAQMYFTNSVNARFYYNSASSYSYIRSIGATATHYAYYCNATARGYIQFLNSTGRFYACNVSGQSILEKRGLGGNIYYSNFTAYFYAYITRTGGTSTGLFGQGRRTQTITNPVGIAPYAVGSAWLNF